MGQEETTEEFTCHPDCLKRSYWRRVFLEVEEEIAGLRPGQLVELVLAVCEAEESAWKRDRPATSIGRKGAIQMYLRSWDPPDIDSLFGFEHGTTAKVVADAQIHPRAQDVVAAHLEGSSPAQISRECKIGYAAVVSLLESIGEEPHRVRDLAKSGEINRAIQKRYEQGWGYQQIADHLGVSDTKVKNRIQYLRRKGQIEQPPRANSNVHRRPRAAE